MKAKMSPRICLENRTKLEYVIPLSTPFILFIDPSSICNFKCKVCPTGYDDIIKETGRWQGQMNFDLYKKIIDDLKEFDKPLKVLRLYKDGEPLLNRNLYKMIKYAKDSKYVNYIDTTTNGFLINNVRMKPIIDAGLDKINISVNGLNSEQFLKFSGVKVDFDKYVENIANLYEIKGGCEIFIKVNGDYLKNHEQQLFYEIFGDICDRISIENTAPCWNEFDVESYTNINISKTKGIYNQSVNEKGVNVCPYIFYSMAINSDGSVSLCFLDWNRKLLIDDIKEHSLKEIWNGFKLHFYQVTNLNNERSLLSTCENCGQLKYGMPDNIDNYSDILLERILTNFIGI